MNNPHFHELFRKNGLRRHSSFLRTNKIGNIGNHIYLQYLSLVVNVKLDISQYQGFKCLGGFIGLVQI